MKWLKLLVVLCLFYVNMVFADDAVIVNGVKLQQQQVEQLQRLYGSMQPGDYWYDTVSGLWGKSGQANSGQISAGLALGGKLKSNASGGGTQVFINGREIHPRELQFLTLAFGYVLPGRYWLNAQGIGGYEGGPAQFDLSVTQNQRRKSLSERGMLFNSADKTGVWLVD